MKNLQQASFLFYICSLRQSVGSPCHKCEDDGLLFDILGTISERWSTQVLAFGSWFEISSK